MKVVIAGAAGQLGRALTGVLANRPNTTLVEIERPTYDVSAPAVSNQIAEIAPDVVINAAAWTDVDGAEANPKAVYAVNALGAAYLADGCARCNALLVQISTNEVFPGTPGRIYREYDLPGPGGVYARSKLAGERAARQRHARTIIARVAWLFAPGGSNFPAKIMAAADRLGALQVVDDEYGNPTYAPDAAAALLALIEQDRPGIYHLVNEGSASRCEFARYILARSGRRDVEVTPIQSSEWPRPAPPPLHAVLVNEAAAALGITLRPWQEAADDYVSVVCAHDA